MAVSKKILTFASFFRRMIDITNEAELRSTFTVLFYLSVLAHVFVSCDNRGRNASTEEAIALIQAVSQQRDYGRILTLADSLEKCGDLSLGDSYFW